MANERWGASTEEWQKLIDLGLTKDLLPVVSNPDAEIASYSTMKGLGKTPSKYNKKGEVVGIGGWTKKDTFGNQVDAWRQEPDYGICLQTRRVRALDIDVDDSEKSDAIVDFIFNWIDARLPHRYRDNSGKSLCGFYLDGDFGKRTVRVEGGIIEFLATGQQFIAAGTHPSGARYEWDWNDHEDFPTLTADEFEALWFALCEEFGTESSTERRGARTYEYDGEHSDDVSKFLIEEGHAIGTGRDGQVFIECPFHANHSTESNGTDTAYFPKGSGGYERGHFVCLHASCADKSDEDFLDAYELRTRHFDVVEQAEDEVDDPNYERNKQGRPVATLTNVRMALERPDICGCHPAYDVFRDEIIFYSKDKGSWRRESDEFFVELRMKLEGLQGFKPVGRELMRDAVLWIAKRNRVDTAIEWLKAQEWDGEKRIETFLSNYMGCEDNAYTRAVSLYMWTGLAGRVLEPGLKADMIPVLKSPEGYRKSSAIEAIAPTPDEFVEIDFSEKDADLARKMRGKLVAEVAELRGLRTRELESILAFVTRRFEEWIPKYREFSTSFPRRLMFIATTNEQEFLDGVREHRRWLPMTVIANADVDAIERDRRLLWAEARERFQAEGLLFRKAEVLGRKYRDDYRVVDSWETAVLDWLESPNDLDESKPSDDEFIRTLDVARFALGIDPKNLKRLDEMRIGTVMRAIGYEAARVYDKLSKKQIRAWKKEEDIA